MKRAQKNYIDPTKIYSFGITMGVTFSLLGTLFLWKHNSYFIFPLLLAAVFFSLVTFLPNILKPVYQVWMRLSRVLSIIMTTIILTILFFMILTPTALIAKLLGKNFLDINISKRQRSYWHYIKQNRIHSYDKQF